MFRFENAIYLNLFFIIPALIVIFIFAMIMKKRTIHTFGNWAIVRQLMPFLSYTRPIVKFVLIVFALISLIIAIANPQFGSKMEDVKRKGIELMIAVDVSNSMLAADIQPNRLENAKRALQRLIDKLDDDKVGLIAFAGDAYTQVPITIDYSATKIMISALHPSMVSKQGTAIGAAIERAMNSFGPDEGKSRVIIIITDGENHEDDPLEMAKKAAEAGIVIHTVGMGLPEGSTIPQEGNDFRRDQEGSVIVSRLDEVILQQISAETGGIYVRANNSRTGLNVLLDEMNKMQKGEVESKKYSEYESRFPYFVGITLILLLLDFILLERRNKRFMNLKLFD